MSVFGFPHYPIFVEFYRRVSADFVNQGYTERR